MQSFTILCAKFHKILCKKIAIVISRLKIDILKVWNNNATFLSHEHQPGGNFSHFSKI